ncbi:MAG: RDD family protein [Actinomycetota bacterium]
MSDLSQGPGWWLASDGKWYPPETAPGAQRAQQVGGHASSGASNFAYKVVQQRVDPLGRPLAHYGFRVGATLIDGVLLWAVGIVVGVMVNVVLSSSSGLAFGSPLNFNTTIRNLVLYLVVHGTYTVAMLSVKGQTLGNMAVGSRVVDAETGSAITLKQAGIRYGIQYLLRIPFTFGVGMLINYLWPLWDDRWQTLHDKVAKTLVVKG